MNKDVFFFLLNRIKTRQVFFFVLLSLLLSNIQLVTQNLSHMQSNTNCQTYLASSDAKSFLFSFVILWICSFTMFCWEWIDSSNCACMCVFWLAVGQKTTQSLIICKMLNLGPNNQLFPFTDVHKRPDFVFSDHQMSWTLRPLTGSRLSALLAALSFLPVRVLQSAPAEASGEAEGSSSDSDEVVEPTADTSGGVEDQLPAPEPAGVDGESSKEPEEDEDELKQVSDLRAESKVCGCVTSVLQQTLKKNSSNCFFL